MAFRREGKSGSRGRNDHLRRKDERDTRAEGSKPGPADDEKRPSKSARSSRAVRGQADPSSSQARHSRTVYSLEEPQTEGSGFVASGGGEPQNNFGDSPVHGSAGSAEWHDDSNGPGDYLPSGFSIESGAEMPSYNGTTVGKQKSVAKGPLRHPEISRAATADEAMPSGPAVNFHDDGRANGTPFLPNAGPSGNHVGPNQTYHVYGASPLSESGWSLKCVPGSPT